MTTPSCRGAGASGAGGREEGAGCAAERFFERLEEVLARPVPAGEDSDGLRQAGVLVPLRTRGGDVTVVLGRRTERVPNHKGQVCFPGGSRDLGDADLAATALREAQEELGIPRNGVTLLGPLRPVRTLTGFFIQPYVARIPEETIFSLDGFEMAEVFEAPLAFFGDAGRYRSAEAGVSGRERRVYFVDFGRHTIWGATARILLELGQLARDLSAPWEPKPPLTRFRPRG